jgi:hypothetical protein
MMNFLSALIGPIFSTIDKIIENKDEAEKIKLAIQQEMLVHRSNEFKAAAEIIVAEAKGESWLQRNWRPVLMLWFAGLIGAHWMGFTAPNISDSVLEHLLDIVKIGIGGYVIGRSTEKIEAEKPIQQINYDNFLASS